MQELADMVGISRVYLSDLKAGRKQLNQRLINALAEALGCEPSDIISQETSALRVPVLGEVGAGGQVMPIDDIPLFRTGSMREVDWDTANCETVEAPPGVYPTEVACVKVRGHSMHPVYRDGDFLFYRRKGDMQAGFLNEDCIVALDDGRYFVKTLAKGENYGTFTLLSYNEPPINNVKVKWAAPVEWRHRNLSK